jgi:hypothetical protein
MIAVYGFKDIQFVSILLGDNKFIFPATAPQC